MLQLLKPAQARAHALQQEKSLQWEVHAPQPDSSSRLLPLEKTHTQQWRPSPAGKKISLSKSVSSVTQLCLTLCNPMDCSTPGLPVHGQLPEFTQTHVHWVSDSFQPSHPPLSSSSPAFNLSQHQGLFKWVSSSHQVAKVSVSASVFPVTIQDWFPFRWTGWISQKWRVLNGRCQAHSSRVWSKTRLTRFYFYFL